ncbi:MAG: PQQ-binding-like beta-propeller repeat protein [Vicinamibacterales bacterium]|nr:PQQ-binding-like beta-propeller repeat protein [Vicinamibacterales bacterium]
MKRLACFALVLGGAAIGFAQVTDQELLKPDPADWVHYSGSYDSHRHSPLKQITAANAASLQAKWVYHMNQQEAIQAVPIVYRGVMYVSQFNRIDAVDARSGNMVWQYQRPPITRGAQRGTAIHNNKLFVTGADGVLVAIDARTGHTVWETKVAAPWRLAGQAPLVAKGRVIVSGNQPSGFIQAYDVETGKHLWTWNAVPQKAGDPGSDTWAGDSFKLGGGPIWVSGSYDPEQNVIFYGTGQPGSQWAGEVREGDNLYTDSIVAIDVDTGKIKWHFQNTPHDVHDWDSLEMPVLIDAAFRGQPRKLLVQANRNGYYYILDRTNGRFLQGTQFVSRVNWASGLSPEGRPILTPGHEPTVEGSHTCPSTAGATNWPSPAYNPDLNYFFLVAQEGCGLVLRTTNRPGAGGGYLESPKPEEAWQLFVRALDATTGKKIWDYQQVSSFHYGPGVLSTAGGLVVAGEHKGQVTVLDARTGKSLWHFNTGDLITSSPISYAIDGQQYIAISSGTNVVAFGLPQ